MADSAAATTRFQMVGARAAILSGPIAESIDQQIQAIENALESVPDFAFDLSKTLVESVCKTVLADIGQPADPNWDGPRLLRETTNRLALLPRNHPDPTKARESVEKTIRGLLQTIQGLCELRNNYGMASHGRDDFPRGSICDKPHSPRRRRTLSCHSCTAFTAMLWVRHPVRALLRGSRRFQRSVRSRKRLDHNWRT